MMDHVNIVCADLERAAHFYQSVFGLQRGFSAQLEGDWIAQVTGIEGARAECLFLENPNGGARLELICYDSGEILPQNSRPDTRGVRHLAFEVENLETTIEKVRALGLEPLSEPVEVPFRVANLGVKRLVYLRDFDGVLVEAASYAPE